MFEMENYDTYKFIHELNKELDHEHMQMEMKPDFSILKNVLSLSEVGDELTNREHLFVSLFVLGLDYLPWDDKEIDLEYLAFIQRVFGSIYRFRLKDEKNVLKFRNLEHGKLSSSRVAQLIYQTYLALLTQEHHEFHKCFHHVALITLAVIEIYFRYGKDNLFVYFKSIDLFLDKIEISLEYECNRKEPFLMCLAEVTKHKKHYDFKLGDLSILWQNLAYITKLFHLYKNHKPKHDYFYALKGHIVNELDFEDNLYPFYHDQESDKLYYIPYILLNDSVINDLLRILVEYEVSEEDRVDMSTHPVAIKGLKDFDIKLY